MNTENGSLSKSARAGLFLGALGVVFGDIGTSPLYTMRVCLDHLPAEERTAGVFGVLSLMLWTIIFAVNFKYLFFVMRADNRGEGGIFALLALVNSKEKSSRRKIGFATFVILIGAALLYGDGVITPAISVLSAAEGLNTFSPEFERYVVPISIVILIFLFSVQSKGTNIIGRAFGPVMLLWFIVLAVLGAWHIFDKPMILQAINPMYAIEFLSGNNWMIVIGVLGSVVLTVTGVEALYADMGHFGRSSIIKAWGFIVFPALLLNYFGQGAYILSETRAIANPFFGLAPHGGLRMALVGLSILATVIASQALISGTYSLTRQAIQLGFFPRLKILHTNETQEGQIYIPLINTLLALATIWVVFEFKSSSSLASVYGIAVTGTMVVTTIAFYRVTRVVWGWALWKSLLLCSIFMAFDLSLFLANLHKMESGGWLPIGIALIVLAVMHTWKRGRMEIQERVFGGSMEGVSVGDLLKDSNVVRVSGTAVFMVGMPQGLPISLLHHLKINRSLHETVILLTVETEDIPHVADLERFTMEDLGHGFYRVIGHYGYMESPDVTALMWRISNISEGKIDPKSAVYFFNREIIIADGKSRLWKWQRALYSYISRNATSARGYFNVPPSQIIEVGLPIQL